MYEYVRPTKIMVALEWLKANNPLYADVDVNLSWEEDAAQDDSELWEPCPLSRDHNSKKPSVMKM